MRMICRYSIEVVHRLPKLSGRVLDSRYLLVSFLLYFRQGILNRTGSYGAKSEAEKTPGHLLQADDRVVSSFITTKYCQLSGIHFPSDAAEELTHVWIQ